MPEVTQRAWLETPQPPACCVLTPSASLSPRSPVEGVPSGCGDVWSKVSQLLLGERCGPHVMERQDFGLAGEARGPDGAPFTPASHSPGPVPRVLLRHLLIVLSTLCPYWPASLGRRATAACIGRFPLALSWGWQGLWASSGGTFPVGPAPSSFPQLCWGCLTTGLGPWLRIPGSGSLLTLISS